MGRKPYYGVAKGRTVGVFTSWYFQYITELTEREECELSVKGFSGPVFKGFNSRADALTYITGYNLMVKQHEEAEFARSRPSVPSTKSPPTPQTMPQSFSRSDRRGSYNGTPLRTSTHTGRFETSSSNIERPAMLSTDIRTNHGTNDRDFLDVVEGMDEDFTNMEVASPSRRVYIDIDDDEPTQPIRPSGPAKRQRSPSVEQSTKRARYQSMDIEIIDLTASPPPKRPRHNSDKSQKPMYPPSSPMSSTPTEFLSSPDQSDDDNEFIRPPPRNEEYSSMHRRDNKKGQKPAVSKPFTLADCSPEQQRILDLVNEGKNIFFTGSAGVGKSFVLQKICQLFKSQGMKQFADFFITASTGTYTFF
jgi:hypothetical protein